MKRRCPPGEDVLAFAEGLLEGAKRGAIERHAATCDRCRERLRRLTEITGALRAVGRGGSTTSEECPDGEALAAYADGSLDPRRASRLERHLARCRACLSAVADILTLAGAERRDAPDRSVDAVVARLEAEGRTAIVRLVERSVTLIRDFARAGASDEVGGPFGAAATAFAEARGTRAPVRLAWSAADGVEVECEVRGEAGGAVLTGRVTASGAPARAASVALATQSTTHGPETPDARGRFGPWPLRPGPNRLSICGVRGAGEALSLSIDLRAPEEDR